MGDVLLVVTDTTPRLTWNLIADVAAIFQYQFMDNAYMAGTVVAIVAGAIGYFVVLRGSAFAAHALSHIGFAGATGAVVLAINPIFGRSEERRVGKEGRYRWGPDHCESRRR